MTKLGQFLEPRIDGRISCGRNPNIYASLFSLANPHISKNEEIGTTFPTRDKLDY